MVLCGCESHEWSLRKGSWRCIPDGIRAGEAQSGAALFFLRDLDRATPAGRGRFTVLMCASCQAARQASSAELLAHYDPGESY
jgi:hypothetical protein